MPCVAHYLIVHPTRRTVTHHRRTGDGIDTRIIVNGPVTLTLTAPPGVQAPSSFPASATLAGGQATLSVKFPAAGYWRIAAHGPNGSLGWVTVDVSVNPDTAP